MIKNYQLDEEDVERLRRIAQVEIERNGGAGGAMPELVLEMFPGSKLSFRHTSEVKEIERFSPHSRWDRENETVEKINEIITALNQTMKDVAELKEKING